MSASKSKQNSWFSLDGQFLRFAGEAGSPLAFPKALWLESHARVYLIKLAKELRGPLGEELQAGAWIQVSGMKTMDLKQGICKLKAEQITVLRTSAAATPTPTPEVRPASSKSRAKILICQKSTCLKRGARAVQAAIEATLRDRGLAEQVTIKATGCMDCCKKGPNIVFMPDKSRYQQVTPAAIPGLIARHCPTPTQSEEVGGSAAVAIGAAEVEAGA